MINILINLVFAIAFIGPLAYGFMLHNWDLSSYVSPSYEPPNINFASSFVGYEYGEDRFSAILEINNMGEVDVGIQYLNASLYGSDNRYITDLYLESPVHISSRSKQNITLYIVLDDTTMDNLITYYLETGSSKFVIKGYLGVKVYSSTTEFPLQMNINVPKKFIDDYLNRVEVSLESAEVRGGNIMLTFKVSNPTVITWKLSGADLELYTLDDQLIGVPKLLGSIELPGKGAVSISFGLELVSGAEDILVRYFGASSSASFVLRGSITLTYGGHPYPIPVEVEITLNRSLFLGG